MESVFGVFDLAPRKCLLTICMKTQFFLSFYIVMDAFDQSYKGVDTNVLALVPNKTEEQ